MGTQSLTKIYYPEFKTPLTTIYRQYDGYPEGHGKELAEFLSGFEIVNGLPVSLEGRKIANGMGCLAAQIIAHFKTDPGGIYIGPATLKAENCNAEYVYEVHHDKLVIKDPKNIIFSGTWTDAKLFCTS